MQQEFKRYIENKKVIFVAPSKMLEGKNLGKWIDSFDVVIRTNNSFPVSNKLQKDYGSKCDILYVNNQFVRECSPFPIKEWKFLGLEWICFKCGVNRKELYEKDVKLRGITHVYNQIKDQVNSPLTGTLLVQDILNCKPKEFYISGMNFYNGKILDWENQYMDGYLPPSILIPAKQKREKGYFTKNKVHDTESNRQFIISLYRKGYVKFDDHTLLVLGLRQKSKYEKQPKEAFAFQEVKIIKEDGNKKMDEIIVNESNNTIITYDKNKPLENLMKRTISIRNAKNAKIGLQDMCNYVKQRIKSDGPITILEIGAFAGDSTEIFARNFDRVISVDPWKSFYDPADKASDPSCFNMAEVEKQFDEVMNLYGNIEKMKMTSLEASPLFKDKSLDIIYVDGNHQEYAVKEDILAWLPKLKDSGIIGGHDYGNKHHPGTAVAVNSILKDKGQIIKFLDTSWVFMKNR